MEALYKTDLKHLVNRGKVRDVYSVDDQTLLIISTDRISAFDVVMEQPIPGKGIVLNRLSTHWFKALAPVFSNHFICTAEQPTAEYSTYASSLSAAIRKRSMLVRKAKRIDIECIVRGYLMGSAWLDYTNTGLVNGIRLASGLQHGAQLTKPLFTPSTKATHGHDEPLTPTAAKDMLGEKLFNWLMDASYALFIAGAKIASDTGLILVDTKFEFGTVAGRLTLIDELLTPDSSRFWNAADWMPGLEPPTPFDKQLLRNWLETQDWNKTYPPPAVPDNIIHRTLERYQEIYTRITHDSAPRC